MELDDFKKKDKQHREFDNADNNNSINDRIDDMINMFRSYEKNRRKKVLYIMLLNLSLAAIYIAIMSSQKGMAQLGYFILVMGFILAVLYLFLRYRPSSAETYALPIREFLQKAERKVSYFSLIDYFILIPLLGFFGTGGGMVFITRLSIYTDKSNLLIIIWVLFFVSLCVFGFWAGHKNWEKEYGDIHRRITEMKNFYSSDGDDTDKI